MQRVESPQFHPREHLPAQNKGMEINGVEPFVELNTSKIAETLESISNDETQRSVAWNLIQQWARIDFASAVAWASARPSGQSRDQLFQHISFVRAQINPAEAATLVVEQIPAGPAQAEAAITVVHQWAQQDFKAASDWVAQFPEDILKIRAIKELQGIQQSSLNF